MNHEGVFFIKVFTSWYHTISYKKEAMKLYSQRYVEIYCNFVFHFDREVLVVCVKAYLSLSMSFGNYNIKNIKNYEGQQSNCYQIQNFKFNATFLLKVYFLQIFSFILANKSRQSYNRSLSLLGFSFVWVGLQSDEEESNDEQE